VKLRYTCHTPVLFLAPGSGEPVPSFPRRLCSSPTSFLLIVSCSSKDGKSALNFLPEAGCVECRTGGGGGCGCKGGGGAARTSLGASSLTLSSRGGGSFFGAGFRGGEGLSSPSLPSLPSFFQPPPPEGTRATEGSLPAFSLRKLGSDAGLGILRLVATTFPRLCSP
jgi:hypothetical protein